MNLKDNKYAKYYLVQEMMGTVPTVAKFDPACSQFVADSLRKTGRMFFTGEGSSRLFPAKNCRRVALTWGLPVEVQNDGSHQAAGYDLSKFTVLVDSNSGRTKEALMLAKKLQAEGHKDCFALSANPDTPIRQACALRSRNNCPISPASLFLTLLVTVAESVEIPLAALAP